MEIVGNGQETFFQARHASNRSFRNWVQQVVVQLRPNSHDHGIKSAKSDVLNFNHKSACVNVIKRRKKKVEININKKIEDSSLFTLSIECYLIIELDKHHK